MRELRPWLNLILQRRGRLVIGALLLLATLISGIALLALSGWFLTETALVGLLFAAGIQAYINLYVPGGGIRFFAVSRTVARYFERLYNHNTVLRLLTDIRVALFDQMAQAGHRDRGLQKGAQWLSRLTADVDALDTLYLRLVAPTALAAVVTLLVVLLVWLLLDLETALTALGFLATAFVMASWALYRRTQALSGELNDRHEHLRSDVIEHLEGFSELTAAGRIGKHAALLKRQSLALDKDQAVIETQAGWHLSAAQLLINLSAVFVLWSGFALFHKGAVSGPVLVMLPIVLLGLNEVYAMLPDAFGKLGATLAAARRLNKDVEPSAVQPVSPATSSTLIASDLTIGYPGNAPVMTHFSLTVQEGERLGIVGASGSGKSSLADTFARVTPALTGTLECPPCAYLTQSTVVFEDTLKTNLLLGNPNATDADLWRVLELVELAERFTRENEGLDTWLGSGGNRLSGGEARRLVLARVLLSNAPLVILDEPFTGVDTDTRKRITPLIDRWLEGRTVISLGHGPEALLPSDHVLHLN
ncbi:MAG: thiol reductant ABC exporter subunit CydC [Gammaproteobacteria bacterium]|uniref:Putative multidrug export ATP-binding/permease protein n=1 Tax=Marinobacter litoralis TaxID=187981 RepID=A0A3M2RLS2_9GAMM|nr:thiol reductant ABC exporter subunit CydC [Marinobacter litoralis]MBR9870891.1 thiol reductant ABC exporter subunit CydC [Gammaproteobacteria bacterium]RMJ06293.1 putative multidrug export ATP-binding/permease protein [Marinobacter litoralis]